MGDESILSSGLRRAKRAAGLGTSGKDVNLPLEGDMADAEETKRKTFESQQRKAVGRLGDLISGDASSVVGENVRIGKSRGLSEYDATKAALAKVKAQAASRKKQPLADEDPDF